MKYLGKLSPTQLIIISAKSVQNLMISKFAWTIILMCTVISTEAAHGAEDRHHRQTAQNDQTRPTVTITSNATNLQNRPFLVTITFSEDVTGFELGDITVGNGTASNFKSSNKRVYTATITPATDGQVTIDVAADKVNDQANNGNSASNQLSVTYDQTKPTAVITSDATNPQRGAFLMTITFSEDITGFELGDITVGNGAASDLQPANGQGKSFTANITPAANGRVTLAIAAGKVNDPAQNDNTASNQLAVRNEEIKSKPFYSTGFGDANNNSYLLEITPVFDTRENFNFKLKKADGQSLVDQSVDSLTSNIIADSTALKLLKLKMSEDNRSKIMKEVKKALKEAISEAETKSIYAQFLSVDTTGLYNGSQYRLESYLISAGKSFRPRIKTEIQVLTDASNNTVSHSYPGLVSFTLSMKKELHALSATAVADGDNWLLYNMTSALFDKYKGKNKALTGLHWGYHRFILDSTDGNGQSWKNYLYEITNEKKGDNKSRVYLSDFTFQSAIIDGESISGIYPETLKYGLLGAEESHPVLKYDDNEPQLEDLVSSMLKKKKEMDEEAAKKEAESQKPKMVKVFENTFFFDGNSYIMSVQRVADGEEAKGKKYTFTVSKDDKSETFQLYDLDQPEIFNKLMLATVNKILGTSLDQDDQVNLRGNTSLLFLNLVANEKYVRDDNAIAARIMIRKKVPSHQIPSHHAFRSQKKARKKAIRIEQQQLARRNEVLKGTLQNESFKITNDQSYKNVEADVRRLEADSTNSAPNFNQAELNSKRAELEKLNEPIRNYQRQIDSLLLDSLALYKALKIYQDTSYHKLKEYKRKSRIDKDGCTSQGDQCRIIEIESLQIEFFEGNIKNLVITSKVLEDDGTVDPELTKVVYRNTRPIAISSFQNIENLKNIDAVAFTSRDEDKEKVYLINLVDIFVYIPELNPHSEDYSPEDQKITLVPNEPQTVTLKKAHLMELLKANVFTDFVGLGDANPNGLIQTEIKQKIIINPSRYTGAFRYGIQRGFFNFIEPNITISKFEENNRNVPLQYVVLPDSVARTDNTDLKKPVYRGFSTMLELRRRAKFNAGLKVNAFLIDIPEFKSSLYINGGLDFYRATIADSTDVLNNPERSDLATLERDISLFSYYGEAVWDVKPHPQIGFNVSFRATNLRNLSEHFDPVLNLRDAPAAIRDGVNMEKNSRWMHSAHFNFTVRPSRRDGSKDALFFRMNFFRAANDRTQNFLQAQVGYTIFLFKQQPVNNSNSNQPAIPGAINY